MLYNMYTLLGNALELDCTNGLKSGDRTPDGYQAEQFIWGQSHVHLVIVGSNPTCFQMR